MKWNDDGFWTHMLTISTMDAVRVSIVVGAVMVAFCIGTILYEQLTGHKTTNASIGRQLLSSLAVGGMTALVMTVGLSLFVIAFIHPISHHVVNNARTEEFESHYGIVLDSKAELAEPYKEGNWTVERVDFTDSNGHKRTGVLRIMNDGAMLLIQTKHDNVFREYSNSR